LVFLIFPAVKNALLSIMSSLDDRVVPERSQYKKNYQRKGYADMYLVPKRNKTQKKCRGLIQALIIFHTLLNY